MFPDSSDLTYFYELYETQNFPLTCWEVRYKNGETNLFDTYGNQIGYAISSPYLGFSLSGFHEASWPDPWINFRLNADLWFGGWSDSTTSISLPNPTTISSIVSDQSYELFYELAHGAETYFQADTTGSYYTSSMTQNDMDNRDPMRFAFIGSCHGMTTTGPGTFSYAFRKGEMVETVTIGYDHMEECPGWAHALEWQDYMFYLMDSGLTIKESFDTATAQYPDIAPAVVFLGDETLKINGSGNSGNDTGNHPPHIFILYPSNNDEVSGIISIIGSAYDVDGNVEDIYIQIDSSDYHHLDETYQWEYVWDTTTISDGEHIITALAYDGEEYTSHSIKVIVTNDENPEEKIPDLNCEGSLTWYDIKPSSIITNEFYVENIGDYDSELNWEIIENPDWGTWTFTPSNGYNLKPADGKIIVNVSVLTPVDENEEFTGSLKIVNTDNTNDVETIDITLTTLNKRFKLDLFPILTRIIDKFGLTEFFNLINFKYN
jgi:hypothetical protein